MPITQQYAAEGKLGVRGPWQGQFTVEVALTGHGGATTGALTETDLTSLLENVLVGKSVAQVGGTVAAAPTSASEFAVDGGATVEAGSMIRVGSLKDNRGDGQFAVVDNASTITLKNALGATPNENDVVYAAQMVYPSEGTSFSAITSTRWHLMTANGQWKARGCFPVSLEFTGLNEGEQPRARITYGVSRWEEANGTFPSAVATDAKDGAIVAAGSVFLQNKGTSTRQTFSVRNWGLTINFASQPLMGPGGEDSYQTIVGAIRTNAEASISLTIDAEASGTNTLNDIFTGSTAQHCCISLSVEDGKALGFYFPNLVATNYVTQEPVDGINRRTINFDALTDTTSANARVMSSWRLAMG